MRRRDRSMGGAGGGVQQRGRVGLRFGVQPKKIAKWAVGQKWLKGGMRRARPEWGIPLETKRPERQANPFWGCSRATCHLWAHNPSPVVGR